MLKYLFKNKMSFFDFIGILIFAGLLASKLFISGVVVLLIFNTISFYMSKLLKIDNQK